VWKSGRHETLRHIQVAPFREGWTVGEATLDNAQFFDRRQDAEAAARGLAARLADAGETSEINIRLSDGASGGRFVCARRNRETSHTHDPQDPS
jgi:hypothetical protein